VTVLASMSESSCRDAGGHDAQPLGSEPCTAATATGSGSSSSRSSYSHGSDHWKTFW
jgi:hypothetical protein